MSEEAEKTPSVAPVFKRSTLIERSPVKQRLVDDMLRDVFLSADMVIDLVKDRKSGLGLEVRDRMSEMMQKLRAVQVAIRRMANGDRRPVLGSKLGNAVHAACQTEEVESKEACVQVEFDSRHVANVKAVHEACQTEKVASKETAVQAELGKRSFAKVVAGATVVGKPPVSQAPPATASAVRLEAEAEPTGNTPARGAQSEKRQRSSPEEQKDPKRGKKEEVDDCATPAEAEGGDFTLVQRGKKKAAAMPKPTKAAVVRTQAKSSPPKTMTTGAKPDALIVKAKDDEQYEALYASLCENEKLQELVATVRRTSGGSMIVQLREGVRSALHQAEVQQVLGEAAEVKAVSPHTTVECRGLYQHTTELMVQNALKVQFGIEQPPNVTVRRFRFRTVAEIQLPTDTAEKLIGAGKMRVGLNDCTLHVLPNPTRCFKCWEFGHQARFCKGEDRRGVCLRCSQQPRTRKFSVQRSASSMQVVQLNLNHCEAAQVRLRQSMVEAATAADIAILSEPYRVPDQDECWRADKAKMAAVLVRGHPIQKVLDDRHEGFVVVQVAEFTVCACYAPPRWSIEQFQCMLDEMVGVLDRRRPLLVAGDFNAWSTAWGSRRTSPRGHRLEEAIARLRLVLANTGNTSTFCKNGGESIIDVTFCSPELVDGMQWQGAETVVERTDSGGVDRQEAYKASAPAREG
ncbi:uncharacterized protein LOC126579726 [Anopheles aquasalis]|uniref:uncharacterized protein LOC126579726 n=1 Tax=Anopheles aquasalis TaxID=42839 RepID=UPI00215B6733|nr:uncharacterized protein LOC126579726 [Anopheles aquasalis]